MIIPGPSPNRTRARNAGIVTAVTAAHLAVFAVMASTEPSPPSLPPPPPMDIVLVRPPAPPPPPEPPAPASDDPGGGAPAAPSRVHTPPPPQRPMPPELPAPRQLAPEQTPVLGAAPVASPTPGMGQGGQGTGSGSGTGAGDGPGRGSRTGPQNLREPRMAELRPYHPRQALSDGVSGAVVLRCRIREDTRLDQCRVLSAQPEGYGFAEAGLAAARDLYRFRPATLNGAYDDSVSVTITLEFGRQRPRG